MFVGTFEHSLDDKGRVVLPSTFRARLADKAFLSQFDVCLALWTEQEFQDVADRLIEKIRSGQAPQDAMRVFTANAAEVKADSQGRITIPPRLREFAELEREVVVIGAGRRIEIWDAARWTERVPAGDSSLSEVVGLGL